MSSFWVVSQNVGDNALGWTNVILREHIAVMGWGPNHAIGKRFMSIPPGDAVLVARRHKGRPDVVGLGVVRGSAQMGSARGKFKKFVNPTNFGSLRNLDPFVAVPDLPKGIPLIKAVNHSMALVRLHPKRDAAHNEVCDWMDRLLRNRSRRHYDDLPAAPSQAAQHSKLMHLVSLPENRDYGYEFKPKRAIVNARKREAELLEAYRAWIEKKHGYIPQALKVFSLTNDCFDERRRNLIEAKASTQREDLRMAVGQLFDYGFYAEKRFGKLNRAILLPSRPAAELIEWLLPLGIKVIWRERASFQDNAQRRFT